MIKLLIADDDAKVRSAINLLLEQDTECWQVIGEALTVKELFLMVEQELPELLLLDGELPEDSFGDQSPRFFRIKDMIRHLRELNPGMYIIVLSCKPQVRNEVLAAGADSFVSKGDPPEVFLSALYAFCGENYVVQNKNKSKHRDFATILI